MLPDSVLHRTVDFCLVSRSSNDRIFVNNIQRGLKERVRDKTKMGSDRVNLSGTNWTTRTTQVLLLFSLLTDYY